VTSSMKSAISHFDGRIGAAVGAVAVTPGGVERCCGRDAATGEARP
jgi:hypothetical protein